MLSDSSDRKAKEKKVLSFEFLILSWEDEKVLNFVSPADWLCYTIRHSPLAIRKSSFVIYSSSLTFFL